MKYAVMCRSAKAVLEAAKAGATLSPIDAEGNIPAYYAVLNDDFDVFEALCRCGLKRNSKDDCSAPTQYMINNTLDLKSVFISPSVEETPTGHFTNAPQIIAVNKYMKQFLDDFGFKYTDEDIAENREVLAEYRAQMVEYKKTQGSVRANKIKHALIKYSACLIPGRERRGRYRAYLKSRFVAK